MDYAKLNFKAGLEIHQQLDTNKLFSRTPSYLRKDKPDYKIFRRLHKIAGETGEIDSAVEHEASLNKEFIYEGYSDTISLVELDESPPNLIDEHALEEAIKIALLLNCEIYPFSQIMRKTVIDGSNTSGFQRTVLIAHSGWIETEFGKIPIESIALEEDSARLISKTKASSTYRLDRLGIPLVEITTLPAMTTSEQVKFCALKIGEILRATKVKRGIGTIRQDVNISIKNHERVEIKGFQDPKMFTKTIEIEIERQLANLKKGFKEGNVRVALPDGKTKFLRPMPGKARMYPETDLPLLKISREKINAVKKKLPKLKTELLSDLKKKGLSDELIKLVLNNLDEFNTLMQVYNKDANLIAKMTTLWRKNQTERVLEQILEALNEKKIEKSEIKKIMDKISRGETLEEALKEEKTNDNELEEEISKIIKEKPGLRDKAYMGILMKKYKGKLNPKKAMEIISSILSKKD